MTKKESQKKWRDKNKQHIAGYNAKYAKENREKMNEVHSRQMAFSKRWAKDNPERIKANMEKYRANNPGRNNVHSANYKASRIESTPTWVNESRVKQIYIAAHNKTKESGYKWHVDHIVPLRSKIVCGLHWEGNMQILTGSMNSSKNNRIWPDMPFPQSVGHRRSCKQLRQATIK